MGTSSYLARYEYNGRGERVLRHVGGVGHLFVYDESGQLLGRYATDTAPGSSWTLDEEIVWLENTPIASVRIESGQPVVRAILSDHLNSPRALSVLHGGSQPAGTLVWKWSLTSRTLAGNNAYGNEAPDEDPDGNGAAVKFDLRFPGQQAEAESGTYYNYFRDYEPSTGRYVESDPTGLYGGLSTYGYVSGNPLVKFDLYGLAECGSTDCCERARQAGLDDGDGGGVVCCGGRKFACAWIDDNPWPDDRDARWMLRVCSKKHEQEHFDEISCSGAAGPERPNRHADMNASREECAAYAVGLKCLRGMEANCRDLVNCPAQVQRMRRHWVNSANSTFQCRGLQNL